MSDTESASKLYTEFTKVLNSIAIEGLEKERKSFLRAVTSFVLENFQDKQIRLSSSDKMLWICSKIVYPAKVQYYFPTLNFDDNFSSSMLPIPSTDKCNLQFPKNIQVEFKPIVFDEWSAQGIQDLSQDLVDNCSFVSAMLSLLRIDPQYFQKLIHPQRNDQNYNVSLYFNGTTRRVNVKNMFPEVLGGKRNLLVKSTSNPNLYWPAIIEKAYLKVLGGDYDTSGSNLALDIFMLNNNWVPEIITIKSSKQVLELGPLLQSNKLTLGLGTGKMSDSLADKTGLISQHDYVIEQIDEKLLLRSTWESTTKLRSRYISVSELSFFSYLYVNWDTSSLFKYLSKTLKVLSNRDSQVRHIPQFCLRNSSDTSEEIWILLECHIPNTEFNITCEIFETSHGQKILTHDQYNCAHSQKSNAQIMLIKFCMLPRKSYTLALGTNKTMNVSIHVYNNISPQFKLKEAQPSHKLREQTSSQWKAHKLLDGVEGSSGGGNWSMPTYIYNPQFDLIIEEETQIILALFSDLEVNVAIDVFYSDKSMIGNGIRLFDPTKLLKHENYNTESQIHTLQLMPGAYKVILSNYDNCDANYTFEVYSGRPVVLRQVIPSLGLFYRKLVIPWNQSNRIKVYFKFGAYQNHFIIHLNANDQNTNSAYRPFIRGSIFDSGTAKPIQVNAQWCDLPYGSFLEFEVENPGRCILLVERFEPGSGECMVQMGCNNQFTVDGW